MPTSNFPFHAGDTVRCIDDSATYLLRAGEDYRVTAIKPTGFGYDVVVEGPGLLGSSGSIFWDASRFVPVADKVEKAPDPEVLNLNREQRNTLSRMADDLLELSKEQTGDDFLYEKADRIAFRAMADQLAAILDSLDG